MAGGYAATGHWVVTRYLGSLDRVSSLTDGNPSPAKTLIELRKMAPGYVVTVQAVIGK